MPKSQTVLGSIPASSGSVESEGWQMKQCWITYVKRKNTCKMPVWSPGSGHISQGWLVLGLQIQGTDDPSKHFQGYLFQGQDIMASYRGGGSQDGYLVSKVWVVLSSSAMAFARGEIVKKFRCKMLDFRCNQVQGALLYADSWYKDYKLGYFCLKLYVI
jgi:hypothetical protein